MMEQSYNSIPQKYQKTLKSEDFLVLTQENKEYRNLFKTMSEKEALLVSQLDECHRRIERLDNEKEEYKIKSGQYASKLLQFEMVKEQLGTEYRLLKGEIEVRANRNQDYEQEVRGLKMKWEVATDLNVKLEQEVNKRELVIEGLKSSLGKVQKELMDGKITLFHNMVENIGVNVPKTGRRQGTSKKRPEPSFVESKNSSKTGSLKGSDLNSISFSFVSGESLLKSKGSHKNSCSGHNKSIYV